MFWGLFIFALLIIPSWLTVTKTYTKLPTQTNKIKYKIGAELKKRLWSHSIDANPEIRRLSQFFSLNMKILLCQNHFGTTIVYTFKDVCENLPNFGCSIVVSQSFVSTDVNISVEIEKKLDCRAVIKYLNLKDRVGHN